MNTLPDDAVRLSLVIERLVRAFRPLTADDPLSQAAAAVLSRLDTSGPSGVTGLARAERVTQPAMTQLIARLHNEGLVSRAADRHDRRSVVVSLTDAGRTALEHRRARRATRVAQALGELDPDERRAVSLALGAMEHLTHAAHELGDRDE